MWCNAVTAIEAVVDAVVVWVELSKENGLLGSVNIAYWVNNRKDEADGYFFRILFKQKHEQKKRVCKREKLKAGAAASKPKQQEREKRDKLKDGRQASHQKRWESEVKLEKN